MEGTLEKALSLRTALFDEVNQIWRSISPEMSISEQDELNAKISENMAIMAALTVVIDDKCKVMYKEETDSYIMGW